MKRTETMPAVRRAGNGQYSKQPRFAEDNRGLLFSDFVSFLKRTTEELEIPPYQPNSMTRDRWMQKHWALEPHWAGVVNQTVLVDSSRAWSFLGGRNQVRRFSQMLHQADGGKGWRHFFRRQSLSYRITDMCAITELGRDGDGGPLRAIYHVDSARCRWTGSSEEPLEYNPSVGGQQKWTEDDFFNVASMPNPAETYNGLGYCQTSRAWDLLRLMYAVMMHDQELAGARFPKGVFFLHNITFNQWKTALRGRDSELDGRYIHYFGGLMVIASEGEMTPDGKLVALSQLPANFDREKFIDQTMAGYALVSGYDLREFWPVTSGALGTSTETETQHRKAMAKGQAEFPQGWQDRFQQEIPPTLLFQFEERDAEGELVDAEIAQAWANVAKTLIEAGATVGLPLFDPETVLRILADQASFLNPDDVLAVKESLATDEKTVDATERERALESPHVRRAIEMFPGEPIVQYSWPECRERVLWERGDDAIKPAVWVRPEFSVDVQRQDESEILYTSPDGDVVITADDVERAVADRNRTARQEDAVGQLEAESVP